jgi:hypothetical protein
MEDEENMFSDSEKKKKNKKKKVSSCSSCSKVSIFCATNS